MANDQQIENGDTYPKPEHGWTCFHCGETFKTVGGAYDHFGATPTAEPGCVIGVTLGAQRGLLAELRKVEDQLACYMREDAGLSQVMAAMQSRHSEQLQLAEEAGYERGLRDGRAERR